MKPTLTAERKRPTYMQKIDPAKGVVLWVHGSSQPLIGRALSVGAAGDQLVSRAQSMTADRFSWEPDPASQQANDLTATGCDPE
jgi:hypothetical protein